MNVYPIRRYSVGAVSVAMWANWVYYWVWRMPEFDINKYWREQTMKSQVLPDLPGFPGW